MTEQREAARERQSQIEEILKQNWVGPTRCLLGSLNEFRHWTPDDVKRIFDLLLPTKERKLSPLGPFCRYAPRGKQRWSELAMKVGMLAVVDVFILVASPLLLLSARGRNTLASVSTFNFQSIGSSIFVGPSNDLRKEAARTSRALCVNKWGKFRILDKGYAAISHVWVETMGLEFNDEKVDQDDRGLNFDHFSRIMAQATRCGVDWLWFDLLAIPRNSDDPTKSDEIKHLKTSVINTLSDVYRNADAVVILDSLTLQLRTNDIITTAAILSCGRWLTRVWTYQEIKIARRAVIVTADRCFEFNNMVDALLQEESKDFDRWNSLRLTFDRLLPHRDVGISLADIAFSSQNRNSTNNIDYARGFFAVLGLKWKTEWTYEDGILEMIKSQPRHAARIANLSGMRGLPEPYSWAPQYMVQLEGKIFDDFQDTSMGLVGFWYTVTVKQITGYGPNKDKSKLIFSATVLDRYEKVVSIQLTLPHTWNERLSHWLDEARPDGQAKLLCADNPLYSDHLHVFLLVLKGTSIDTVCDATGIVSGTAVLNGGELEGERLKWRLL